MEIREGTVLDKNQGKIKDKKTKQTIIAENPGKVKIKDNDVVKYISFISHEDTGQRTIHVIKDKKK